MLTSTAFDEIKKLNYQLRETEKTKMEYLSTIQKVLGDRNEGKKIK